MSLPAQLAKHLRDVHFGGNWTCSNLKAHLADVSWEQATTQVHSLNTIATLAYHMHYYIVVAAKVLQGAPLVATDKESFMLPPITSQREWEALLKKIWADAEHFAALIEVLPEHKLWEDFADTKYGNYFRNINGIIEHLHYHLGQIVVIKKLIREQAIEPG